jgi:hypothetical protein
MNSWYKLMASQRRGIDFRHYFHSYIPFGKDYLLANPGVGIVTLLTLLSVCKSSAKMGQF